MCKHNISGPCCQPANVPILARMHGPELVTPAGQHDRRAGHTHAIIAQCTHPLQSAQETCITVWTHGNATEMVVKQVTVLTHGNGSNAGARSQSTFPAVVSHRPSGGINRRSDASDGAAGMPHLLEKGRNSINLWKQPSLALP
jgi:hypothetical protein